LSSGNGSPVSKCRAIVASTSGRHAKFSRNWLGSSTASQETPLMPAIEGYPTRVSMWCRPWPNSWNIVTTSSCVSSAGLPSLAGRKLQTR
jgi:hypothetical protein